MKNTAVILAAGTGQRFGTESLKQFSLLNGIPMLWHSVKTFRRVDPDIQIILVLQEENLSNWNELQQRLNLNIPIEIVFGGNTRSESVKAAIDTLKDNEMCFIHDSARPCVSPELLQRISKQAIEKGNAVPIISSPNSLRIKNNGDYEGLNRDHVVQIQTPQCYSTNELKRAYSLFFDKNCKDDSELLERSGTEIHFVSGDHKNIKVTYPFELDVASVILKNLNQ